jgi:hypothetical protein
MTTPLRILGFLVALALVFAAALGVGHAVGPVGGTPVAHDEGHGGDSHPAGAVADLPGGLMVSESGYTLALEDTRPAAGQAVRTRFAITGADGAALTAYDVEHEKQLHLIAVRRDLAGYQHVHPVLGPDGSWSVDLALTPGPWRLIADFTPAGGDSLALGADLSVAGRYRPDAPAVERRTASVDGYDVTLTGDIAAGDAADLIVSVQRDGRPVTDLEPYLGAYGHLVALREGDLAYLHVHPVESGPGPDVPFVAEVPSTGGYRLFFDFRHDGAVRTAELAAAAGGTDEH